MKVIFIQYEFLYPICPIYIFFLNMLGDAVLPLDRKLNIGLVVRESSPR